MFRERLSPNFLSLVLCGWKVEEMMGVVGTKMTLRPHKDVLVLISRTRDYVVSHGKRDFTGVIKGLEIKRLSRVIQVGQCNHKSPYQREQESHSERRTCDQGSVMLGSCAEECRYLLQAIKGRKQILP